eukprot:Selendium_serpulae@DN5891_c0_g2_i1.p1
MSQRQRNSIHCLLSRSRSFGETVGRLQILFSVKKDLGLDTCWPDSEGHGDAAKVPLQRDDGRGAHRVLKRGSAESDATASLAQQRSEPTAARTASALKASSNSTRTVPECGRLVREGGGGHGDHDHGHTAENHHHHLGEEGVNAKGGVRRVRGGGRAGDRSRGVPHV